MHPRSQFTWRPGTGQDSAQKAGPSHHPRHYGAAQTPQRSGCGVTATLAPFRASERSCHEGSHRETNVCSPFSACHALLARGQSSFAGPWLTSGLRWSETNPGRLLKRGLGVKGPDFGQRAPRPERSPAEALPPCVVSH